ncbi:MAG: bifunctional nicotinamidase/pyrazinamidase [Desulforhopalus sp.]|jgi:nicotinamidase/pyrazinamidase|nr:bifunctional nicotinamidase/pyrazinamidase [Desulforhopalus sp.]
MSGKRALLLVDVQNDFCPGGTLPVPEGDRVIDPLNRAIARSLAAGWPIFASRDWHPPHTSHFVGQGGTWPAHCVQQTSGADFHPGLRLPESVVVVSKGSDPQADGYSAFEAVSEGGKTLAELLAAAGVEDLLVGGLATDYCVRATVLDALRLGFSVALLEDGVAGVEIKPGDSQRAVEEMRQGGTAVLRVDDLGAPDRP